MSQMQLLAQKIPRVLATRKQRISEEDLFILALLFVLLSWVFCFSQKQRETLLPAIKTAGLMEYCTSHICVSK